ncbi:MAG: potassium channel family protein [Nitrososphaeria archaeon]
MAEGIRYKPISVREILKEMHDTTTLMVDLAYSSIIFNDKDLAEEVIELNEKIKELRLALLMHTAIVIKDADDAEALSGVLQMGAISDFISHAAKNISNIILLGLAVPPEILSAFAKTQERFIRVKAASNSILLKKTIDELSLETNIGVKIIAVRRGHDIITNPSGNFRIVEGDILIAKGSDVSVSELDKLAKGELKSIPEPNFSLEEW